MRRILYLFLFVCFSISSKSTAQSISSSFVIHSFDVCATYIGIAYVDSCNSSEYVKTYWGDGTDSTSEVHCISAPGAGNIYVEHQYAAPGTYSVKMVLYNGLPVDSVMHSCTAGMCRMIWFNTMLDENANCVADSSESLLWGELPVEVDSAGVPIDTLPGIYGYFYSMLGPAGTPYAFRLLETFPGTSVSCPGGNVVYDTIPGVSMEEVHRKFFMLRCDPASADFDLSVHGAFYPRYGYSSDAYILVNNENCAGTLALLKYDFSPKYTFSSIYPAFSYTVSGNSVTIDVGTVHRNHPVQVYVHLDPLATAILGDSVHSTFTVSPITGDTDPVNNVFARVDTIRAAWDPNQKSVTPSGDIAAGTALEYMLEFENTGNDTAHNIHILDTLSAYLDMSTFKQGISSHRMEVIHYSEHALNIVKFDFPNIMLPDSSHHYVCKGMATFTIKTKSILEPGTEISNRAGIYFDVNPVVMTNTVYNRIPIPGVLPVGVYPNPVHNELTISGAEAGVTEMRIYNSLGQLVHSVKPGNGPLKFNITSLAPGMYYAILDGEHGRRVVKFIKE